MWLLRAKPHFLARAFSALNCRAIFPAPKPTKKNNPADERLIIQWKLYKTKDIREWKDLPCSQTDKNHTVKTKAAYRLCALPIKIPVTFLTELEKAIPKLIWKQQRSQIPEQYHLSKIVKGPQTTLFHMWSLDFKFSISEGVQLILESRLWEGQKKILRVDWGQKKIWHESWRRESEGNMVGEDKIQKKKWSTYEKPKIKSITNSKKKIKR